MGRSKHKENEVGAWVDSRADMRMHNDSLTGRLLCSSWSCMFRFESWGHCLRHTSGIFCCSSRSILNVDGAHGATVQMLTGALVGSPV